MRYPFLVFLTCALWLAVGLLTVRALQTIERQIIYQKVDLAVDVRSFSI
jgi:hypothetical protein